MKIAVIPARGGSKRIPRKNIKLFGGRPIIAWSVEVAIKSGLFEHVIVTTDDHEIADTAMRWGAEVPFMRPVGLSDDMTPTVPVIAHAVKSCLELEWPISYACCIYPCTPFIQSSDIISSLEMMISRSADFAYPVAEYAHPIQRAMRHLPNGKMQFLESKYELTRTQDLEKSYHDAGQFYWGRADAWLDQKKMHTDGIGIPIPNWRVVDIDSQDDWRRAELIFSALMKDSPDDSSEQGQ